MATSLENPAGPFIRARYTLPKPPEPSRSRIRYRRTWSITAPVRVPLYRERHPAVSVVTTRNPDG